MDLRKEEGKATVSHQGTVRGHTATNVLGTKREPKYASHSGLKMGTWREWSVHDKIIYKGFTLHKMCLHVRWLLSPTTALWRISTDQCPLGLDSGEQQQIYRPGVRIPDIRIPIWPLLTKGLFSKGFLCQMSPSVWLQFPPDAGFQAFFHLSRTWFDLLTLFCLKYLWFEWEWPP